VAKSNALIDELRKLAKTRPLAQEQLPPPFVAISPLANPLRPR
jgi:hypothetical protein